MSAENGNVPPAVTHQVGVNTALQMEVGASFHGIAAVNVEIITEIATALENLRPLITDQGLLDHTVAAAHELEKGGLTPEAFNNTLMAVLIGLSLIFAKHFAASAGDDLGHAAVRALIQAVERLLN